MNRRDILVLSGLSAITLLAACGNRQPPVAALKPGASVLALGDSLTAGHGAAPDQAWPAVLGQLAGWQVDNEGVNGDTSAGALQRLAPLLAANRYDAILVGIGGNDMLRRVPTQTTRDNVAAILRLLRKTPCCYAWKEHGGIYGTAGIPDIIACINGRFVAFEVKTETGKLTKLQEITIQKIRNAKGQAFKVTSATEVAAILKELED